MAYNSTRPFFIILLFIVAAQAAYDAHLAKSLAYICASTFGTEAQINSWTCKYCAYNDVLSVTPTAFKSKLFDIYGFTGYMKEYDAIVVTFRSTVSIQNWIVDLDAAQIKYYGCEDCLVHQGFYTAWAGVEAYVRIQLEKLLVLYSGAKIYVTGFSLGSALSTIAALDIQRIFGHVDQHYTFGEPRVGNQLFAEHVKNRLPQRYRVIYHNDIVPHIPPQTPLPYAHFSHEVWYYGTDLNKYKICGAQQFQCCKSVLPTKWTAADHDLNYYFSIKP